MARLDVLEYPDPRLRRRCEPVERFDEALHGLVDDLFDTLYAGEAIGLAAPQVDRPVRVLVMDLSDDASAPQVFVNPEILSQSALGLVVESCLSLPGVVANVVRATEIRVRAQNRDGDVFERDLTAMDAVCLQHELDHLDGRLFVDRLSFLRRWRIRAAAARARRRREAA